MAVRSRAVVVLAGKEAVPLVVHEVAALEAEMVAGHIVVDGIAEVVAAYEAADLPC